MNTTTRILVSTILCTCLSTAAMAQVAGFGGPPNIPGSTSVSCSLVGHVNVTGAPQNPSGWGWVAQGAVEVTKCTLQIGSSPFDCSGTLSGIGTVIDRTAVAPGQYRIDVDYAADGGSEASQAMYNAGYTQYAALAKATCTGMTSDGVKYQIGDIYTYP
jgi:hypothetical protein